VAAAFATVVRAGLLLCGSPSGGDDAPCGSVGELDRGWHHLKVLVVVEGFASGGGVLVLQVRGVDAAAMSALGLGVLLLASGGGCGREGGSHRRSSGRLCGGRAWWCIGGVVVARSGRCCSSSSLLLCPVVIVVGVLHLELV
jgi:hypothetical protein